MTGTLVHFEIKVTNMARAKKFYGKLFGWKFQAMAPGYVLFDPGKGLGGALDRVKKVAANGGARPYFEVSSIDETLKQAARMKAKILAPKSEIGGNRGFFAVLRDSEGNQIGIWNGKGR